MIKATDRTPPAKPPTSAPVPSAEPGKRVKLILQILDGDQLSAFGVIDIAASKLSEYTEAIEAVPDVRSDDVVKMGRPGQRLICIGINEAHPDYQGLGKTDEGDPIKLGQVRTTPQLVRWFLGVEQTKTSVDLVRYYTNQNLPYEKNGYTFRDFEAFKKDLKGPLKDKLQTIALAHAEWAKENQVTPFE